MNFKSENIKKMKIMEEKFELIITPASVTYESVSLFWGKIKNGAEYEVYCNGEKTDTLNKTVITVENLSADTEYEFYVKSGDETTNKVKVKTKTSPKIFDVTGYGAVGDGVTDNTKAIQKAIDACCENGMVYIPDGVFMSGAVYLKSDMTLKVDGKLMGVLDTKEYPVFTYRFEGREEVCYSSLVNTYKDSDRNANITICGKGEINANGKELSKLEIAEGKGSRGRTVCIRNTDGVYVKDVILRNSPAWCLHFIYCSDISVDDIEVYTKYDENGEIYGVVNGDGIDPDSSKNVYIYNCKIESGDDCVAIKSGRDEEGRRVGIPSENIYVISCTCTSGFGIATGSEVSGGVKNVLARDCTFINAFSVGSVKSPRGRGAVIENVRYENCSLENNVTDHVDCEWFRGGIYIDNFYSKITFDPSEEMEVDESTPKIRNICFENIKVKTVGGNAMWIAGLPESPLENIYLRNINAHGKNGLKAYNIKGISIENVNVKSDEDMDWMFKNVE